MSEVIRGHLEAIEEKSGVSKQSGEPYTLYSVVVDGRKYGTGFDMPKAREGSQVEFSAAKGSKGYWDADMKTFRVLREQAEFRSAAETGSSVGGISDLSIRDRRIQVQTAWKVAPLVVDSLVSNTKLKVDSYESYMELAKQVVLDLCEQFENPPTREETEGEGKDEYSPV